MSETEAGGCRPRCGLLPVLAMFAWIAGAGGTPSCFASPDTPAAASATAVDAGIAPTPSVSSARAHSAHVLIASTQSGTSSTASGVILRIRDGVAYVATARHVVDHDFPGDGKPEASEPAAPPDLGVTIMVPGGAGAKGKVEWMAPGEIDLAILSAPLTGAGLQEASWDRDAAPRAGDPVFALGGRGGAGGNQRNGTLAQVREMHRQGHDYAMLQADMAILPGDSGGGLYDGEGRLIGITSMGTPPHADPRFPKGIGIATALAVLLDLAPKNLGLEPKRP